MCRRDNVITDRNFEFSVDPFCCFRFSVFLVAAVNKSTQCCFTFFCLFFCLNCHRPAMVTAINIFAFVSIGWVSAETRKKLCLLVGWCIHALARCSRTQAHMGVIECHWKEWGKKLLDWTLSVPRLTLSFSWDTSAKFTSVVRWQPPKKNIWERRKGDSYWLLAVGCHTHVLFWQKKFLDKMRSTNK